MSEEEPFLRAILAAPEDSSGRLVYADWLEERGDGRAEYIRLGARLAGDEAPGVRRRMVELRANLPAAWLALLGDHRATSSDPPRYADTRRHGRCIVAAATHGLTGALACVERRSRKRWGHLDVHFHLRVRDRAGREAGWEVQTYNPYFGCDVRFLGWYGDVAVVIYREKHRTYAGRFGLDCPAEFRAIEDDWVLDGRHLGHRGDHQTSVRRLAVPGLEELPLLSADEAAAWALLPPRCGYPAAQLRLAESAWWVDG